VGAVGFKYPEADRLVGDDDPSVRKPAGQSCDAS
jgi:hypothetical protein